MTDALPTAMPPPDPEALMRRIAQGDRAAFRALYDATAPRMHGLALRLTRSAPLAEEVVQELFLAVWRHAASFDPARGPALPWMARILRNRVADRLRRREPARVPFEAAFDIPTAGPGPDELARLSEDARRLAQALGALPPRLRAVLEMAYFAQAGYREIAAREGVPVNTVKSWVRRALIRLRAALAENSAGSGR
jgi:RNA polymerase sigma-70 factor (ECF subfamily)